MGPEPDVYAAGIWNPGAGTEEEEEEAAAVVDVERYCSSSFFPFSPALPQ